MKFSLFISILIFSGALKAAEAVKPSDLQECLDGIGAWSYRLAGEDGLVVAKNGDILSLQGNSVTIYMEKGTQKIDLSDPRGKCIQNGNEGPKSRDAFLANRLLNASSGTVEKVNDLRNQITRKCAGKVPADWTESQAQMEKILSAAGPATVPSSGTIPQPK